MKSGLNPLKHILCKKANCASFFVCNLSLDTLTMYIQCGIQYLLNWCSIHKIILGADLLHLSPWSQILLPKPVQGNNTGTLWDRPVNTGNHAGFTSCRRWQNHTQHDFYQVYSTAIVILAALRPGSIKARRVFERSPLGIKRLNKGVSIGSFDFVRSENPLLQTRTDLLLSGSKNVNK